jgi:hypothetical protein
MIRKDVPSTWKRVRGRLSHVWLAAIVVAAFGWPASTAAAASGPDASVLAYQAEVIVRVADVARSLPNFAGIYFDSARDGRAVVLLTALRESDESKLTAVAPAGGIDIDVVPHSYAELQGAVDSTVANWSAIAPNSHLYAVALDTKDNGIDIYVPWDEVAVARTRGLEKSVGVPVRVFGSDPPKELNCPDRDHCTYPEKAGIRIHRSGAGCTMAFHVRYGADEQFVTAGHCGYGHMNLSWYHTGLNYAMVPQSNAMYGGIDIMRVNLLDSQASSRIYGESAPVKGWWWPVDWMYDYVSAGYSDRIVRNVITSTYVSWYSGTCGCWVHGAQSTSTPGGSGGDSGSPVYAWDGSSGNYALGVADANIGGYDQFALIGDAISYWGITLVTS